MPEEEFAWPAFAGFESTTLAAFTDGFRAVSNHEPSAHAVLYFVIDRIYRVCSRLGRSPWLSDRMREVARSILLGHFPRL